MYNAALDNHKEILNPINVAQMDKMKLQNWKYKCEGCGNEFLAPQLTQGSYAEFLLRSSSLGELRYLNAIEDKTYEQVDLIIKSHLKASNKPANAIANILRKCYGDIACDTDINRKPFQIGASPVCPACGSQTMEYWESVEPLEIIDLAVKSVSHRLWDSLSEAERIKRVDIVLSRFGY